MSKPKPKNTRTRSGVADAPEGVTAAAVPADDNIDTAAAVDGADADDTVGGGMGTDAAASDESVVGAINHAIEHGVAAALDRLLSHIERNGEVFAGALADSALVRSALQAAQEDV